MKLFFHTWFLDFITTDNIDSKCKLKQEPTGLISSNNKELRMLLMLTDDAWLINAIGHLTLQDLNTRVT
jgi:hypothetical protein